VQKFKNKIMPGKTSGSSGLIHPKCWFIELFCFSELFNNKLFNFDPFRVNKYV